MANILLIIIVSFLLIGFIATFIILDKILKGFYGFTTVVTDILNEMSEMKQQKTEQQETK